MKLLALGISGTITYLLVVLVLRAPFDLDTLRTMPINDLGDALTGVLGPVGIFWLILGFYQQGRELKQNGEALHLQAEELRNAVEQHKEMVAATRDGLEFTKARHEEERSVAEKLRQPHFIPETPSEDPDAVQKKVRRWWGALKLSSQTGPIHDLVVICQQPGFQLGEAKANIESGQKVEFCISPMEGALRIAFPRTLALVVHYRDSNGGRYQQVIIWEPGFGGATLVSNNYSPLSGQK